MGKIKFAFLLLAVAGLAVGAAGAAEKIISGVPNYDQDVFPIDHAYASVERGDCNPIACTMLNGYYDAHGWPRLIPYGSNSATQNGWGVDTVVRKYKEVLEYEDGEGTSYNWFLDRVFGNKQGDAIVSVVDFFDPGASFTRDDDDMTKWSKIQDYLNADHPCVLTVFPAYNTFPYFHNYNDTYKWEGSSTLNELGGGHSICAAGWSDAGGRWVICNMGWSYSTRAWFNADSDDDWYISQITPGGTPSAEDDDPIEDNDRIGAAKEISAGTVSGLHCLDTLIVNDDYKASYGDWYKIAAAAGNVLSVTIGFDSANGNLDLRVYGPGQTQVGSSTGTGDTENVTVSPTGAGYYYIYVYGNGGAQNQTYSLSVSCSPAQHTLTTAVAGGHGTLLPETGPQSANAVVNLTAAPETGYQVKAWTGTDNDTLRKNVNTVTMTGDRTVNVEFQPMIGSVVINGNRSATNSPEVTLALTWGDAVRMRFSEDGAHWTMWEPLAATRVFTLAPGPDGHRTVRVQFLDIANNRSAVFHDYIRLDTTPPTGTIVINGGALSTPTAAVTLGLTWADAGAGVSRMRFSDDGAHWTIWEPVAATRPHTLPEGPGYHTVRVQYLDGAGNRSIAYNDYIRLLAP